MAEYSITNSAPRYTVQSTYQTYTKEMGANTFRWTNATVGQQLVRFDFSDIPEGATINDVEMAFQSNDDYSGYGYQTIMSGNTGWKTANNANIKEWLTEHDRVVIVRSTFQGMDGKITSGTTPPKATRTVTRFSVKVTYTTAAGTSYVKYGTADVWQKCEPYFIVDGEAQKCDVYYGDGDEWVKISTDE